MVLSAGSWLAGRKVSAAIRLNMVGVSLATPLTAGRTVACTFQWLTHKSLTGVFVVSMACDLWRAAEEAVWDVCCIKFTL